KDGHINKREIDPPFLPAGTGDVDLIAASKAAQYAEYIVVELDAYDGDMLRAVEQSYRYLTDNNIALGKS
ncbi:MAG: hypothetical protein ISR40_02700, partial [Puniceicoccaceae bacterium]|nr:hypothetical protein [Puniceicoccaceae bacterium]